MTNYHVINGSDIFQTTAKLPSGAFYQFKKIIGGDKASDIAILQFDGNNIPHIDPGNSDNVTSGEPIYAIGSPLGLENSVSSGVISSVDRLIGNNPFIQFTAPISSGNSGGGLVDSNGNVIGIVTESIQIPTDLQKEVFAQNLNFAIPINNVEAAIKGDDTVFTQDSPIYYYSIAVLADDKDDYDRAITYYQKAIALDSQFTDAYIGLGGDYYEKGNYDLELSNYLKGVALDTKNVDNNYWLGTAYEDVAQYDKAITTYQNVLVLNPNYKDALNSLALVYLAVGQKDNAQKLLPQLTELDAGLGRELSLLLKNQK